MRLLKQWKSQQLRKLSDGFHQPGFGGVWREGGGGGGLLGTRLLKLSGNVLLWRVCYWGSY